MDVLEAIRHRRSVKPEKMKPDPVDEAIVQELLEAANWAPSHGHTEPWRFVVFRGEARKTLAEAVASTYAEPEETLKEDDPRRLKLLLKMTTAPVVVAVVCEPDPSPKIVLEEELMSTAIAVQNMHLAARAKGLAAFWSSGKKAFHPNVARFLDIEPPARCLGFFYIGYPSGPWPESTRRPISEKVTFRGD